MGTDQSRENKRKSLSSRKGIHFEALEPRILFDASAGGAPTAEVTVSTGDLTANADQFINDNIEFNLTFDNNGGQEGYVPYVDFLGLPEMVIESVTAFGGSLANPEGAGVAPIGVVAADGQLVDINSGTPVDHPMYGSTIGSPSSNFFGGAGSGTAPVTYNTAFEGFYVYSVQLPFGSFTPGNPPADIAVEASLNDADGIIANTDYTLHARGGFALGCDPLDNPGTVATPTDEPVFGDFASSSVYPIVLDLVKSAGVFEGDGPYTGETVSGPNFPLTYRLEVDVATGETVSNLNIIDVLPDDLAYLGSLTITDGAGGPIFPTSISQPAVSTDLINGVTSADNNINITIPNVTGVAGADIIVTYEAFVPYVEQGGDLVVNDGDGEEGDLDEFNDARASGDWTPDGGVSQVVSDNAGPANGGDPDGVLGERETDYVIEEHSIAIQKSVGFAPESSPGANDGGDRAASGWSEGDVAEFTMNFQISDYFAFDNVIVNDLMADGLEFLPDFSSGPFDSDPLELRPVLTFAMHAGAAANITVAFDESNILAVENVDGTTSIQFDVYQQLVDSNYINIGDPLLGGLIPVGGTDPADMGSNTLQSATVGSITYRAKVRNEYVNADGDPDVNQGDTLSNAVTISGRNLDVETLDPNGNTVTDGSATEIEILTGTVQKELFSASRNGDQRFPGDLDDGLEVVPGDVITWRITYDLPLSEFENLRLEDYLPLPVFDVDDLDLSQIYAFEAPTSGNDGYLTAGRVSFGENDTFFGQNGPGATGDGGIDDDPNYTTPDTPLLSSDSGDNAFFIDFGDYDIPESEDPVNTTIEIFVSTVITDAVYAEGLLFTNQVATSESNSFSSTVASNEIAQIVLGVPDLEITKGVLSVDSTSSGVISGSRGPLGVDFNAPGSAEAFNTTTGDPITSDALDTAPIDANLQDVDAGDVVTFGLMVQNRGSGDFGAFDVQITDTLPAGFTTPADLTALNLRVTDGIGDPIAFNILGGGTAADFFASGIELVDPGPNAGSLSEYDGTSGTNLVLIAYDLVVEDSAVLNSTLTNTATVTNFSYVDGGPNYAEPEDTDTASVTIERPTVVKEVIETSHVATSNEEIDPTPAPGDPTGRADDNLAEVAIGEVVTYTVRIEIPEGTLPSVVIRDTIQPGMAFVGVDSISFDSGLTTSKGAGDFSDVDVYYDADLSRIQLGVGGTAGLGTIVNSNTDNTVPEQVTITYKAVVLNDAVNQSGVIRSNDAEIRWQEGGNTRVEDDSVDVRVVEPNITVNKSLRNTPATVEGADTVTYRIVVRNNGSNGNVSEGYDVELSDSLPAGVTFVSATYVNGANGLAPDTAISYNAISGELTAAWDTFDVDSIARFDVEVRVNDALPTDTVITNTAEVEFTSLPGERGDAGYNGYDPATDSGSFSPPPVPGPTDPAPLEDAFERTGDPGDPGDNGGNVNDYNRSNSATVTVINPVGIDKVVIETSEDHTAEETTAAGDVQVAIGEVVRYEVRIRVPQATSTGLELADILGEGLEWIPAGSNDIQFRLEGFNPDGSTISAPDFTAPELSAALTGSSDFPAGSVSFDGTSNTVTFDFGDIVNTETDSADEFIYISYNAIVQNKDPDNVLDPGVTRGAILTNTVQLSEGGVEIGDPLTQVVTVVEPDLTISKSDNGTTTADAGDVIDYTLTVTAGTSNPQIHSTAFDLSIADALPDQLELVGGSVSFVGLPGTSIGAIVENVASDSFTATVDRLEPGETFQITFQGTVRDTGANIIEADETVTNTASLRYSTLPGDGTDATTNGGTIGNETGNEAGTPGDTDGERITDRSNSDSFTSPAPVLSKVLATPSDTTFTIGETVEYVITLQVPEGELGDPEAFILDQIDPGFRFVPGTLSVNPSAGISVGVAGALNEANTNFFTHTDPGNTSQPEELQFDFDQITFNQGSAGDGLANGTIVIRYELQVENILTNQQGDQLNNTADFFYTDENGTTRRTVQDGTGDADTIITIVEPQVDTVKATTVVPATPEAGEVISYEVTLTNPGSAGNPFQNVTAFDVTAQDVLPTNLDLSIGTFTATSSVSGAFPAPPAGPFTVTADGWSLDASEGLDLVAGEVITITYDAVIDEEVRDGEALTNEVDAEWTSIDGTTLGNGVNGERTGDGNLNDDPAPGDLNNYESDDEVTVFADFPNAITKTVLSTSSTATDDSAGTNASIEDLVIGETVTYEIVATLGRGTNENVRIIDQLSTANGLLDITNVVITPGVDLALDAGDINLVTASITDTLTNGNAAGTDGFNDRFVADFGTVVNSATGARSSAETITFTVTARLVNDPANQQGDVITNTATLEYRDDPNQDGTFTIESLSDSEDVEIIEPQIDTDKTTTSIPTTPEAGEVISYEVTLTNPGGVGNLLQNVTAFDVTAQDVLPTNLDLSIGTFTATSSVSGVFPAPPAGPFTVTVDGWSLDASEGLDLVAGEVITIVYDAVIQEEVRNGEALTNEVDAEWTSIDGTALGNGVNGERTGDEDLNDDPAPGDLNNYESDDEVTVFANFPNAIAKTVLSTSSTATSDGAGTSAVIEDLVIGETVTYEIVATLGRGTNEGVRIIDQLSTVNGLLDITNVVITPGSDLALSVGDINSVSASITDSLTGGNVAGTDGYNDRFVANFGTVINSATGARSADETIRFVVTATLVNDVANQQGDVIENTATLEYQDDPNQDGNFTTETLTDTENVEVIEPQVDVNKTTVPATPVSTQAGDIIDYRVTLTHSGGPLNPQQNVTAFDVTAQDVLPTNLDLNTGSFTALLNPGIGQVDVSGLFNVTTSGWTLTGNLDLDPGDIVQIDYGATIDLAVRDGDDLVNEVDIEWTSTDGANADERGGNGDLNSETPGGGADDYEEGDNATIRANLTPQFDFEKLVFTTSEAFTGLTAGTSPAIPDLVIGETVTFDLVATLGRGTTDQVRIVDQLSIANGLLDITNVQIQAGAALSLGSGNPFSSLAISESDSVGGDGYNDRVEIDFGTVINDPALITNAASEQIRVRIEAVLVNEFANQEGDVIRNTGTLTFLDDVNGDGTRTTQTLTDNADVEVVEPVVNTTKTITNPPANPTAGERIEYRVVLSNPAPTAGENIIAFDVTSRDDLPDNLSMDVTTFEARLNGALVPDTAFTLSSDGWALVTPSSFDLNQDDELVITYEAVIQPGVQDGETLLNEVDTEWSSLNGTVVGERSGNGDLDTETPGGQPNDYESGDTAEIDAEFTSVFAFDKSIVSTSESTGVTGGTNPAITDLVVGETVTYALTATLGRGTTDGVRIIDQLSIANGILDITNVTINPGAALQLESGNPFSSIIPVVTDSAGSDTYLDRIEIDFGTVVNDPSLANVAADEQIEILVTALVVNVAENTAGDVIQNTADFFFFDDPDGNGIQTEESIRDTEVVEILEPNLSITKSVDNDQPRLNEILTYTLTVSNNAGVSTTDAFDLVIDDLMDSRMVLDISSVQLVIQGAPVNPSSIVSNTSTAHNLVLGIDRLDEGHSIEITYEVRVSSDIADFNAVLPNDADLNYTSIEGANPEERGGDPLTNDPNDPDTYTDNDDESVEVFQPDLRIEKVDFDAVITPGSLITYQMTVTNQGRAEAFGVNVTDDISHYLDGGFAFLNGTNATLTGGIVTFDLPDMPVNDVQIITMVLQAPDAIPAGLESITNIAVANHDDIDPTPLDNEDPEETPVIAVPDLVVTKDDGLLLALTGDEITYVIEFTNVGDQIASGVIIEDNLPPGMEFVAASDGGILRGNSVFWGFGELAPGEVRTVEVTALVREPGLKINTVTIRDDGRGGPDPTPENNRDTDETLTERRFFYDLTQDFRTVNGNQTLHEHRWGSDRVLRREPVILATYMASGLAQAGSTITLEVYDERGQLIADTSVVTDAGGNWLASFPMADVEKQPARIEMKQTWASYNPAGERSYNFRTYFGPAFSTGTYYTEQLTVLSVMEKRNPTEVIDLYESSKMILAMDWNGQLYEFAARGALQSSSGN